MRSSWSLAFCFEAQRLHQVRSHVQTNRFNRGSCCMLRKWSCVGPKISMQSTSNIPPRSEQNCGATQRSTFLIASVNSNGSDLIKSAPHIPPLEKHCRVISRIQGSALPATKCCCFHFPSGYLILTGSTFFYQTIYANLTENTQRDKQSETTIKIIK